MALTPPSYHSVIGGRSKCHTFNLGTGATGIVDMQKASAVWILKTRELHQLPLSVMDAVMVDIQSLYDISLQNTYHRVTSVLRDAKVDTFTIEQVSKEFTTRKKIFSGLETQSQQMKYFTENFNMVVILNLHV